MVHMLLGLNSIRKAYISLKKGNSYLGVSTIFCINYYNNYFIIDKKWVGYFGTSF